MSAPGGIEAMPDYAEIGITTNFSFLRGGSDPRAYVHEASRLQIPVIGIADRNTLAGVVRAHSELGNPAVEFKPKLLIGARIVFIDGTPDILVYPRDRAAYGRLCQLLTRGKRGSDIERVEKGECRLTISDLLDFAEGQLLVLSLPHRFDAAKAQEVLAQLRGSRAHGVWLAASLIYRGDDRRRLARLHRLAASAKVPLLATNGALSPSGAPAAAGRADLYPRKDHHRGDRPQARGQCRALPEACP
jgi:error-prone DNA polymerase